MSSPDERQLAQGSPRPTVGATPCGWSENRLTALGFGLCALFAVADALLGHRVILIGLLIVGPCCGVLTGRWLRTAFLGGFAVVLAVVLGVADGIWGTFAHVAFLVAVIVVAVVSTLSAAIIERFSSRR